MCMCQKAAEKRTIKIGAVDFFSRSVDHGRDFLPGQYFFLPLVFDIRHKIKQKTVKTNKIE